MKKQFELKNANTIFLIRVKTNDKFARKFLRQKFEKNEFFMNMNEKKQNIRYELKIEKLMIKKYQNDISNKFKNYHFLLSF